jgi:hypothetical protein
MPKRGVMRKRHELENLRERQDRRDGVRLCSAVPGRMRWQLEALRDRPRYAATVAMTLEQTAGILAVQATPLTGRLLVHCDINFTPTAIASLVHAALQSSVLTHEAGERLPKVTPRYRQGTRPSAHVCGYTRQHGLASPKLQWRGQGSRPLHEYLTSRRRLPVYLGMFCVLWLALALVQWWWAISLVLLCSLLITPLATARLLTARLRPQLACWLGFAVWNTGLGCWLAAQCLWMPTVFIAVSAFASHLGVRWLVASLPHVSRLRDRPCQ